MKKRWMALLLAAALMVSLTACGGDKQPVEEETTQEVEQTQENAQSQTEDAAQSDEDTTVIDIVEIEETAEEPQVGQRPADTNEKPQTGSSPADTRYHLLTKPAKGGMPIRDRAARVKHHMVTGIRLPMPWSWSTRV